ncbi:cbb3-type cytochrome c oxidase subunit I [Planococcus sp. X10-3]|uniref:cbb3-type cytochrome c oxidase subunit I n=1 Tax=Planococcus sp. X10-3 TaxID=3061240 RepID=UPI003BAF8A1B
MGTAFIKIAAVYLLIGIALGIYMGITDNFQYGHLHAHINLLGWSTTAIFGVIYYVFSRAGDAKLGKIHFWLHNIGTPLVLLGMYLFSVGQEGIAFPMAVGGSLIVLAATLLFVVNVFTNLKERQSYDRSQKSN